MAAASQIYFTLLGLLFISFFSQASSQCPRDWFNHQQNCYYFSRTPRNWYDAETTCKSLGRDSHLASILNDLEMRAISSTLTIRYGEIYQVWIGLYSSTKGKYRIWQWTDNAAVDYTPWAPNQPSNCGKKQNCVELYMKDYMKWNDEDCDVEQPFLCKLSLY